MSDDVDKNAGQTGTSREDAVFRRKGHQCPHCKAILQESYLQKNPLPEIPCSSCGVLISIETVRKIELTAPDQRVDPRVPVSLKVSYKTYDDFIVEYTKNVSRQGMFIRTRRPHEIHDAVHLFLHVPGLPDPVHIIGEVVRVNIHAVHDEDAGIGLKFVDIDEKSRQVLISFIKSHESRL
jgi:uncharacterized protein (TIGR02266 family)